MKVYLVYDECHGMLGIYANKEKATEAVKKGARECVDIDSIPPEYDSEDCWGWEDATWWKREEVIS